MPSDRTSFRTTLARALRQALPWVLALAVATCTDDQNGPSHGGRGYFAFRPVYGINGSLSQFGIVADSVHIRLTRPVNQVVLDTTVFFPADSSKLRLALPVALLQSPETLTAVIGISAGPILLFTDSLDVAVVDGPPSVANIPTVVLSYVGPGKNVAAITLLPGDTTIFLRDTLFFSATAVDSAAQPVAAFFVGWKTSDTTVAKINGAGRLIAPNLRGSVKVIGSTPTGIVDTTTVTFAPVPVIITADSGNAQAGVVADSLGADFVARVKASDSLGVPGITVRWTAVTAGGAVRDTLLLTDANGRVRTRGVFGDTVRVYSYTATVVGHPLTTTFTATAAAGAASAIALQSGSLQTDSAGRVLPAPFVARVTDAFGNVVSGAKVYWTRTAGTGTVANDSVLTNASGLASTTFTLGAVGSDTVTALLAGTSATVTYAATAINGAPATATKVLGDTQTAVVDTRLTDSLAVVVKSATAYPVVGAPVVWTVVRGGLATPDTAFTDVNGRAAIAYTLGTASGTDSVRAQAGAIAALFTATAQAAAPSAIGIVSGNAQVDTAHRVLPLPLVVAVTDTFGNPVTGAPVTFVRIAGHGTPAADTVTSVADNHPSTAYTLGTFPGTDSIRVTLLANGKFVTFTATAVNATPSSLVTSVGNGQSATVGTAFTDSLVAQVLDGNDAPIAGEPVVFVVTSGTATLAADTVLTDSLGFAVTHVTGGNTAGTVQVTAHVATPISPANFTLTLTAGAPTALTAITGDLQTDTAGTALPLPFGATVVDAFGNPVAGARVAFTRIAGDGTVAADTVTADVAGVVTDGYAFGTLPGSDTVRATLVGTAAFHDFVATAVPATPASVATIAGDSQTIVVGTESTDTITVVVRDAASHPIAGVNVDWAVIPAVGGLTVLNPTGVQRTVSDSFGRARAVVTAGTTAQTVRIEAQAGSAIDTIWTFQVAAAPSAIALVSGDAQTDTTGRTLALPLTVHVTDAHGNAIAGAKVAWARVSGSGTPVTDTTLTSTAGDASTGYTLGAVPGTDTIRATLSGTGAFVDFTATAVSGAPAGLLKVFGDAQVDTVKATLADSLIVQLKDGSGTSIPNAWLYWQTAGLTLSADSTKTDANGRAAVQATFGTAAAKLVVAVRNVDTTVAAVFNLRAKAGTPTQLTLAGGDAQTGVVNSALALPFRVIAQDAYGNPADSIRVAFTRLAGSGAVVPDTATTDTLGLAQAQYTLGGTAGTDTVQAKLVAGTATLDFTATATAGAAASLTYVAGTGQSDTVHSTLASPFTVLVRDAGNNPVPGVWVHFTRIHGTGTVLSDSSVTDLSGVTATGYTLGTAVGLDSVVATLTSPADTVAFYAATTVGAAKTLAIVSGDSQSAAIGATLAAPLAVRITDQFANPIVGASVTFDTTLTGGSIAGATTVTDATGLATSGAVTLGAAAGTSTFIATTPVLPADTAKFTAIALPLGTSSQWTGALSTNWGTAGNWSPAAVPASSDNVFIPAAASNQPVLDAARTIGGLQVETGATVALGANSLTTVGNTQVDGTVTRTSGFLVLAASSGTARGNLAGVRVTGNVTLNGATTVADSLQLASGSLVVGGQALTINGAFSNNGSGTFTMTNPADSVTVTGATLYNGGSTLAVLTAGTLVLDGPFTESSGSTLFQATGTHTTVFNGGTNQTVTFAAASLAGNHFQHVVFANPSGITLGGNIAAAGNASVTAGVVTGTGRTAFLGGSLSDPTSLGWNVATTSLAGSPGLLPDSILGNLDVTGTVTLAKNTVVKGNLTPNGAATLAFGGFRMRVDGSLTVSGTAQVLMQNATDTLDVAGAVSWNGSTSAGLLTNGVLVLRGNFSEPSGSSVFQGSGAHKTLFAGSAPQSVAFAAAGIGGNRFADVEFANPAGVTLTANAAAAGNGAVTAGTVTGSTGAITITVGGNVADPTSTSWQVPTTVLAGTPTALPDSFPAGVTVTGTVTLAKPLVIKGAYAQSAGAFTPNGFHVRIDSTFNLSGGQVLMQNPVDTLDVAGTTTWNGSTLGGQLTAGTLIFRGNFSEPTGSTVFSASGTHATLFAGTAAQTATFAGQSLASNHFQDLVIQNAAGVNFTNGASAAGNASLTAGGVITTNVNQTVTVAGNVSDPTNVSWRPEITSLTGTPTVLPDSFARNVTISGTVTLSHPVAFKANLSATNGAFTPNGFHVRVDSALSISGGAQVTMQNVADTLDVGGLATWNGSTSAGLLTAGTLILRGDFSEPSGSTVFAASGTHVTLFAGSVAQAVTFGAQSLASNHFQDLVIANAAGVNFANGGAVAGNAAVTTGGVLTTNANQTVTVAGNVTDPTSVSWRPETTSLTGTPTVLPDSFARNVTISGTVTLAHAMAFKANLSATNGAVTLNGFHVRVDSALNISGGAQMMMQNTADTLDVAGLATWNGSTTGGLLTAGTLILRGDFSEPSGSTVFAAGGTHVTVLAGSALQTVTFGAQSLASNHFQDLVIADAAGANFTNGAAVAGNASVSSGFLTTNVNQTVTVAGNITDPSSVSWRPETTSLTGTPTVLPDSFTRNVTVSGTVTLPHAVAVRANLSQTAGTITVNGFALRVDSALSLTGGAFQMQNAADSVDVGGAVTWNGSTAAGLLTAGTLVLRGDFSEPSGSSVFQASGTHTTVFKGAVTHTVTFGAPGANTNRFNDLRLEGPTTLALGNNLAVNGTISAPLGLPVTIGSTAGARAVTTHGLSINTVTFDSVRVSYSGPPITFLQNVTFQHQDPTTVQFAIAEAGSATPDGLQNVQFLTTPTTGKYISATDTLANGSPLTILMYHSFPFDGTPFEQQVAGADGATIDWSTFKFLIQPVDGSVLGILDTVQVQMRAPDGNPDANFTGNVSLALGANPGSATLGGTTTVAAVLGVAKFGDLTVSAAGIGYTLVASTAGIAPDTSAAFNITVPLPVGFTSQWLGNTSADWNTASNWSTGTVPDSTTNVFVSGVSSFAPSVQSASGHVNRLRIATGATVAIASGDSLVADSTVEAGTTITGAGTLILRKTGTISGQVTSQAAVLGTYAVAGTATFGANLDIAGALDVGPDTLQVTGLLQTSGTGTLGMSDLNALVDVTGPANFAGGSTTGRLTLGTFRVTGDLTAVGGAADAFAPAGSHRTVLNGPSTQQVIFGVADSLTGSHFGILQVGTTGVAFMHGHYDALGDVTITTGATLADSIKSGFTSHGFTTVDAGGTLAVNNLLMQGGLGVAVGGTYSVPTTIYGPVAVLPVNPAPYDTLVIEGSAAASADLLVTGDLRISGSVIPARFDVGGHTVTVNGSLFTMGNAAPVMQNGADLLDVKGGVFPNGGNTTGLLTAGVLQVGGDFHQSATADGRSFRAQAGHTTRFTGTGVHRITFDTPGFGPADSTSSEFGILDLPSGTDSLTGTVTALGAVTVGGSVVYDTTLGNAQLIAFGPVDVQATAPLFQVHDLGLHDTIAVAAGPVYQVFQSNFYAGTTLPILTYQNVAIYGPSLTLPANLTIPGSLGIGQYNEVGPDLPGDLAVNGHVLTVGTLGTGGLGTLTMAGTDSVDVKGDVNFSGGNSAGHLAGGALVVRGSFSAGQTAGNDSTFVAAPAFRTILADTSLAGGTIYLNTKTESGLQFGKLLLLDAAPRNISSFGYRLIVRDSLVLGATGAGFNAASGSVWARGPLFGVSGSALTLGALQVDSALVTSGAYNVATTIFGGTAQSVPALPYNDVTVWGTASLTDSLIIPAGTLTIGGAGVPADLTMGGHLVRAASFATTEQGVVTMTNAADTLDVLSNTTFGGGNETGKLTAGVLRLHGAFTQDSTNSPASFYASGTHETRFTDSAAVVHVAANSMGNGASRFNLATITGGGAGTGVTFDSTVWIGGNVSVVSPTISPVGGRFATLDGDLSDPSHLWAVDTTSLTKVNPAFPDSMAKDVWLATDTLAASHVIGGELHLLGELVVNGHSVQTGGQFFTQGTGVLNMTHPADSVTVGGKASFTGGSSVGKLTAGRLTLLADLYSGGAGMFDATGTHKTVLAGAGNQSLIFDFGGPQGYGVNDLVAYNNQLVLTTGVLVHGTFADSQTASFYSVEGGSGNTLDIHRAEFANVQFVNVIPTLGDSSQVDTLNIYQSGLDSITQLTVRGAGRTTPLDLHEVGFFNLPTTGKLLQVTDTAANGDSIVVRMFGGTPFNGKSLTLVTGEADARWATLALSAPLPATVDSAVPFGFGLIVKEPDGSTRSNVVGSADIALAANPPGATLGGTTTATFDGSVANYFNLTLDKPGTGLSFHLAMQGQPLDSFTTTTFDVVNPAPLGAIIWDGSAGNGLWSDTMNWSTGTTPTAGDSVFIGAGQAVTFNTTTTVAGLVLGQGATLDLQGDLTVTGRVAAGNTITSAASALILKGTNVQVSGTLPRTTVEGTALATGPISITGDLMIDSAGGGLGIPAGFDLNGHRVDVSGTLWTRNSGLFTMTAPGDSLFVASGSFSGGDETGHLTDGVLVIQGSGFDQAFGDPNSFHASGNHTTIFANGGSAGAVNIGFPANSQFANVKVQNPLGVNFNESGLGLVRITGDLTVSAGGYVTGDTVAVGGNVTSFAPEDSIVVGVLQVGKALAIGGTFSAPTTDFTGHLQVIPAVGYQTLQLSGDSAMLGANVVAGTVIVHDPAFGIGGHTLHTGYLAVQDTGRLVMTNALDTVIADTNAQIQGGYEAGLLTAGTVVLGGNLQLGLANYIAAPGHLTRFVGATPHSAQLSIPAELLPGPDYTNHLGSVEVIGGPVYVTDPAGVGAKVMGDLTLIGGTVTDSGLGRLIEVFGNTSGDAGSGLSLGTLAPHGTLGLATPANYLVTNTTFRGTGQHIPGTLPYQRIQVEGSAILDSAITPTFVWVQHAGQLDLGGHTLTVDTSFFVNDSAHLVMHAAADSLNVLGTATFQGADATGDLTDGTVRALRLIQQPGTSGSDNAFVQTGNGRVRPLAGDTITMTPVGPNGSRIGFLDLNGAGGTVTLGNLWVGDSLVSTNPFVVTQTLGANNVAVSGNVRVTAGMIGLDTLAVGGTIAFDSTSASFGIGLTKFIGTNQTIPADVPYHDVQVYYPATLGGNIDRTAGGWSFAVVNTGDLDLNGHTLKVSSFQTGNLGRLTMHSAADSLVAQNVTFDGDSTNLSLTAGTIVTGTFTQQATTSAKSYAPTGTHRLVLDNLGQALDGVQASFATPGLTAGSHANILVDSAYQMLIPTSMVVADSFLVDTAAQGFGSEAIDAYGPVILGSHARLQIDSLIIHDTLVVDPAATYQVTNTVYSTGALGLTDGVNYQNVILDSSFVLTAPFHVPSGTLVIRGTSNLTPNGHRLDAQALQTTGLGTLTMKNAADSVVVQGLASFDGDVTGGLLTDGHLILYGNLAASGVSFEPNGSHTIRFAGSHASHTVDIPGSSNATSWLWNVVVADSGTLGFNGNTTVIGTLAVQDSATLTIASATTLELFGSASYGNDVSVKQSSPDATINYNAPVTAGTGVTYDIKQSNFYASVGGLPDLTYQELAILDGSAVALSQNIATSGNLTIASTSAGGASLDLNGHTVTTNAFILGTGGLHGLLKMSHANDTLLVNASATFGGDDESTFLTNGVIRVGGSFTQHNNVSGSAFAATGTRTEFFGTGIHPLGFDSPAPGLSHFADLSILDGGTLQPVSGMSVAGTMTIDTSSTFDAQFTPNAATIEVFGKTNVLDLGQVSDPSQSSMFFHDSLIVASTGSYSVYNTIFQGTDGIPNVGYTHMYLRQGVHLTLTHQLFMTGGLNIQNDNITGNPADTVTIRFNGNKVIANGVGITGYARLTMDDPADSLVVGTSITWRGLDEDTALSAGVIQIGGSVGGGMAQNGQYSARSFAPAGTRVEFVGPATNNASFTNPGTGASHFADLVVRTGTLQPLTPLTVTGATTVNAGAHFNGSSVTTGAFDFFGPVTVVATGDFHSTGTVFTNFYDATAPLTVNPGATTPYDVLNTGFAQTNVLPNLAYQNLYLNNGTHDTLTADLTLTGVLDLSSSSAGNQDLVLNGHTITAGALRTELEGRLTMDNPADQLVVSGNAIFGGGDLSGRLTAGTLSIGGDFTQGGGSAQAFVADSDHVTKFLNTGNHAVSFANPTAAGTGGSHFGSLELGNGVGMVIQTATDLWAEGSLIDTASSAPTLQNTGGTLHTLTIRDIEAQGITFDHLQLHLQKSTLPHNGVSLFAGATFANFLSTEDQLLVDLPGTPSQFNWGTFTFTALNTGDAGHYVVATDTDGGTPDVLTISLGTNNWGVTDPPFYVGLNGAVISPFAP